MNQDRGRLHDLPCSSSTESGSCSKFWSLKGTMFSTVRADPVSGRDQYKPVQQRGQTELDHKLAVLHWSVLVETSPFLLMLLIQVRYGS
jgi:hypothetical protein